MELHKPSFFDKEAAVDALTKGCFWDKSLIKKRLFEIYKGKQNARKPPQNALKRGGKKNFHFGDLHVKKWEKVGALRKKDRQKR